MSNDLWKVFSHWKVFYTKKDQKNFAKLAGKFLCWSLFL